MQIHVSLAFCTELYGWNFQWYLALNDANHISVRQRYFPSPGSLFFDTTLKLSIKPCANSHVYKGSALRKGCGKKPPTCTDRQARIRDQISLFRCTKRGRMFPHVVQVIAVRCLRSNNLQLSFFPLISPDDLS